MDRIPPLRADVRVEDVATGKALFDAALGRRVKLDARGAAIAVRLSLGEPVDAATLASEAGIAPDALLKLVNGLMRLNLLATSAASERVATERIARASPSEVPILVRPDARFSCTMCGGCCGGHMVGPVSQEVLDGLDEEWPALERETGSRKGLFFALPAADAAEIGQHVVCHASGGSCVFLTDDRKCLIHKRFGGDKKPEPCRIFPYEMVATPDGVVVTVQRECRGFLEAGQGKRLVDDLPDIREILALVPELATVGQARTARGELGWDDYKALEERLHTIVDASEGEDVFVALLREAGVEQVASDVPELRKKLDDWTATFTSVLDGIAGAAPEADERVLIRLDGLLHLRAALLALRPDFRRVALPLDRADQRALLKDHLHHALMGKALVQAPTIELGLARLSAQWCLTKALAVTRAREVKRRHLVAQDVMDALVIVSFMHRHADLQSVIAALDAQTLALFGARLDALRAAARELADPDTRVELVKF